jgi:hypothetical protein
MKNLGTGALALIALGVILLVGLVLHLTGTFSLLKKKPTTTATTTTTTDAGNGGTATPAGADDTALAKMRRVA